LLGVSTIAGAHSRSGSGSAISGYLGASDRFDAVVERWALEYADQNARDHAALVEAIRDGRVPTAEQA